MNIVFPMVLPDPHTATLRHAELESVDERLCALGRGEGALRLRIGEVASELRRRSLFFRLGFAKWRHYGIQRCGFGLGWLEASRRVAERLDTLPRLRETLRKGEIGWSMAELCSRHAMPETEAAVLEKAERSTVRQMKAWLAKQAERAAKDAREEPPHAANEATRTSNEVETTSGAAKETKPSSDETPTNHATSAAADTQPLAAEMEPAVEAATLTDDAAPAAPDTQPLAANKDRSGDEASDEAEPAVDEAVSAIFETDRAGKEVSGEAPGVGTAPEDASRDGTGHEKPRARPKWADSFEDEDWLDYPPGRAERLAEKERAEKERAAGLVMPVALPVPKRVDPAWEPLELEKLAAELDLEDPFRELKRRSIERRVPYEDVVAFEITRMMAAHVTGSRSIDVIVDALLSEAESTLVGEGKGTILAVEEEIRQEHERVRNWLEQCAAQREACEAACEPGIPAPEAADLFMRDDRPLPTDADGLDDELVGLCAELANRDLEIGALAQRFVAANGPSRLRYASVGQYARERMGISMSMFEHKRTLARRVLAFPELGEAIAADRIGCEVALRIGRIATPETIEAWIDRVERRTVKNLDEEIRAAELLSRHGALAEVRPPTDDELAAVFAIEEAIMSGELMKRSAGGDSGNDGLGEGAHASESSAAAATCDAGVEATGEPAPTGSGEAADVGRQTSGAAATVGAPVSVARVSGVDAREACGSQVSEAPGAEVGPQMFDDPQAEVGPQMFDVSTVEAGPQMFGVRTAATGPQMFDDPFDALVASARQDVLDTMMRSGGEELPRTFEKVFRGRGMGTLRLRLSSDLALRWQALERAHRLVRGPSESFVLFLCKVAWTYWGHEVAKEVAYKHIHARDHWRCRTPVCWSKQVTAHHLIPRSKKTDESNANLVTECYVCHIPGIHDQGWLKAERTPTGIRWTIGYGAVLVVHGRELVYNRRSSLQTRIPSAAVPGAA